MASALSQVGCASYHLSGPSRSVSLLCRRSTISAVHLIWGVISGCDLLAGVSHAGSQVDVVSSWGPAHGLVEGGCRLWGRDWSSPLPSGYGSCMPVSLPWRGSGRGGEGYMQLALSFGILSPLLCEQARLCVRAFRGKVLSPFYFSSLEIPQFGLLSHISFLRLSSGPSGLVLTLRTDDAAPASLSSPPLTSGGCEHLSCFSVGSCG